MDGGVEPPYPLHKGNTQQFYLHSSLSYNTNSANPSIKKGYVKESKEFKKEYKLFTN